MLKFHVTPNNSCLGDVLDGKVDMLGMPPEPVKHVLTSTKAALCDKATQKPAVWKVPYKDLSEQTKRPVRADIIDLLRDEAMKAAHFVPEDLSKIMNELLQNKNFC